MAAFSFSPLHTIPPSCDSREWPQPTTAPAFSQGEGTFPQGHAISQKECLQVFSKSVLSLFLSFSFSKSHGWRGRPSILYPMSTASFLAQCVAFFFFGTHDKENPSVPPRTLIARVATVGQTIGLATTALADQHLIERGIRQSDLF